MRRFASILLTVGALLAGATVAFAQQATSDLRGRVVDQQGAAVPGVAVVAKHQESGLFRETVSGADGSFFMSAMTPGTYEIAAELVGFRKYQRRDVVLDVGRATAVDIELQVGSLEESVTVTGESPLIDTSSKEIGGHVSAQELLDVPSFNRNFVGYLGNLPGVVASVSLTTFGADSISVAGQNIRNVNYTMDGSNNNDTFNGGNGGAQARVPVEAVQEFQLLTSQFDAEYGLASGGVVNAVSKQGTNALHGSGFTFFQDQKVTALDYFADKQGLDKPPTKQQQFGGTLGGPVIRNKAHFFASVERVILDGGVTVNVPTRPEFNRTDFENTRVWNTFLRFDNQLSANHTWGVRWLNETSPQPVQLLDTWTPSRTEAETDIDGTVVGTLSSVFGATRVNTFRVSWVKEDVFFGNPNFNTNGHDQKVLLPQLTYQNFQDQQSGRANRRLDVAYGADNTFAWFVPGKGGDHELKFGGNYLYSTLRVQNYTNMNGLLTFPFDLAFDATNPRTYPERLRIRVSNPVDFLMYGHFLGVFAQDKWKVNDHLTLSLGARYDIENLPTPNSENPLFAGDPAGYPMDKNNVSPRLGFAYAIDPKSAIRGGFGVFFQRTSYTFLTNMFSAGRNSDSFEVFFPTNNADAGPRAGNFPGNTMLLGGTTVNHAAIDALYPPGTRQRNGGTVRFDNPDREVAWSRQYSIGYERELGPQMAVTVDYIRSDQRNQYMLKSLNPGIRDTTLATSTLRRINPLVGSVGEWAADVVTLVNEGSINYDSLQVSVAKRPTGRYSVRLSYAYSKGRGNNDSGQADDLDSQLLDQLRLDLSEGPTSVNRPHIFSLSGSYDVPRTGGLKVSGGLQARSGTPFSIIDSTNDFDRNGFTTNEYLPAGTYSGTGEDAFTVENTGGRRGARGPNFMSVSFRSGYRIRLPRNRTLDAFLDVFNLTNEPNFANPTGDRRNATFLRLTTAGLPTRTAQFNMRYGF